MPGLVGEEVLLARDHHRVVAQHDPAVADPSGQVATLAVVDGARADLGEIGHLLAQQPRRDVGVARRPEVVGVGQERIANPHVPQRIQQTCAGQGQIDVAMSGGAPFQLGVSRPVDGREGVGPQLGLGTLQEPQGQPTHRQIRVCREDRLGLHVGAERVHEDDREGGGIPLAQREHLAGDDIEEGESVADRQGRLGSGQPHARAQSTIELDDGHLTQCCGSICFTRFDRVQSRQVDQWLDRGFGDRPERPGLKLVVVVGEDRDRPIVGTPLLQPPDRLRQAVDAHVVVLPHPSRLLTGSA